MFEQCHYYQTDKRKMKINYCHSLVGQAHHTFFSSLVIQIPASVVNPERWSGQSRGPDCSSIILNSATILTEGELTVLSRRPGSVLRCAAGGSWSEHARNELPVTLRSTSILHEVSSSNKLGIVLRRWLTWPSSRPDTHRGTVVTTQTTHCQCRHTHTHIDTYNTQSWEPLMEFQALTHTWNNYILCVLPSFQTASSLGLWHKCKQTLNYYFKFIN